MLALLLVLLLLVGCAGPSRLAQLPAELPERVELTATPFHPQTEHQCGPAALATVLGAAGRNVDPAALATEVYLPGRQGSLQPELAAAARARGLLAYETGPSLSDLLAEVAAGRPALVLQQLGAGPWPYLALRGRHRLRQGTRAGAAPFRYRRAPGGPARVIVRSDVGPGRELGTRPARTRHAAGAAGSGALHECGGSTRDGRESRGCQGLYAAATLWPKAPLPRLGLGNLAAAAATGPKRSAGTAQCLPTIRRRPPRSIIVLRPWCDWAAPMRLECVAAGHGPRGGRRPAAARAAADRPRLVGPGGAAIRPARPRSARSSRSAERGCGIHRRAGLDFGP